MYVLYGYIVYIRCMYFYRLERNLQKSTTLSDELEASQLKLRGYNQLEGEFEDLKKVHMLYMYVCIHLN